MLTSAQLTQLRTELNTDPTLLGYLSFIQSGNHTELANIINLPRVTIRVKRDDVQAQEIFHAIAVADLVNNPGASQLEWFNALLHAVFPIRLLNEDGTDTPVRTNVLGLVRSGTTSLTRLAALQDRDGSRGEQLFGRHTRITIDDIGTALRLP